MRSTNLGALLSRANNCCSATIMQRCKQCAALRRDLLRCAAKQCLSICAAKFVRSTNISAAMLRCRQLLLLSKIFLFCKATGANFSAQQKISVCKQSLQSFAELLCFAKQSKTTCKFAAMQSKALHKLSKYCYPKQR